MINTLSGLSNNMQVRDKSVKALQYAARLICVHQQQQLSTVYTKVLTDFWITCSMGRKVFRLGKSITSLHALMDKLARLHKPPETVREVAFCLEMLEHIFMSLFFYYDHVLLLGRARLLPSYNAKLWESRTYGTWLLHDLTFLVRKLLLLGTNAADQMRVEEGVRARYALPSDDAGSGGSSITTVSNQGDIEREVRLRLVALRRSQRRLFWDLIKALCDVNVSGRFFANSDTGTALVRGLPFCREGVSARPVALFGFVSAIMAIVEAVALEAAS